MIRKRLDILKEAESKKTLIMKYFSIIIIFLSISLQAQISKKELDQLPAVAEIVQPEPFLVSIGNKKWSVKDFTTLYRRSLQTDTLPEKNPSQFLSQFIENQLKIAKAEKDGLDTTQAFKEEVATIKRELLPSFMVEKSVNDALIKEAYERLETEVNVAHILIALDENASPNDTLLAYNKLLEIRNKVINGEKFNEVALKNSNDASVAKDEGNLGYISAFQTVYPFETACYTTPVGKISMPFRTIYGYHIVKIIAKREFQRWKAAHIFIAAKSGTNETEAAQAKKRIEEIYTKLQNGENFEKAAKLYSEDITTNTKGGVFKRMFGTDELEKPFEDALFSIKKVGNYASPISTSKGWHIVKLIEKQELKPFNDMYNFLQNKVAADPRSEIGKKALLSRIKKENEFKEIQSVINDCNVLIDSLLTHNLPLKNIGVGLQNKTIFSINEKDVKAISYFNFVENKVKLNKKPFQNAFTSKWYKEFEEAENLKYEEEIFDKKNQEFGLILNEYKEGILLNTITDGPIWSHILQDTTAQLKFYNDNKETYTLPERIKAEIIDASNGENLKKAQEIFPKKPYQLSFKWSDLLFPKNQSEISEQHTRHLVDLSLLMHKNPDYLLEVAGNIDPEEAENVSIERAQNVINQLVKKGVPMDRIVEKDNGKFQPVSKTEREKNRRVSFGLSTNNKQAVAKLYNALKPESIKIYSGYFKKGENKIVDLLKWQVGEQQIEKSGRSIFAQIEMAEPARIMTFQEAKGKVIKAIQIKKESEFLAKLKGLFPVIVNDDLLKKVTK